MKKGICTLTTIVFIAVMLSTAYAVSQPIIYTSSLPKGVINQGYGAEIAAKTDETTVIEWIIVDGSLPDGLTLDRYDQDGLRDALGYYHGWINGTPTKTGTFSFTVQAAPVGYPNLATTRNYSITITEGEESSITTCAARSLGTATVGEEFSLSLTSLGKYKFFSGGELPEGLSMSSTNVVDSEGRFTTTIEGIPTQEGTYKFFITTCNKNNLSTYSSAASHGWLKECTWKVYPMTLTVNPAGNVQSANFQNVGISAQPVPSGTIVTPKDFPSLSGGRTPIGLEGAEYTSGQFTSSSSGSIIGVIDGVLPDGLQYSASESAIIGTPTKAGIYTAIIAAKGSSSLATARPVTIEIEESETPELIAQLPKITTQSLDSGRVSEKYSETIAFTGASPVTFSVINGELPDGLTLEASTGKISGTPTQQGSCTFIVEAANSSGRAVREFVLEILQEEDYTHPNIELADTVYLQDGTVGEAYNISVYNFGIDYRFGDQYIYHSGGNLPPGLSLKYSTTKESATIGNLDALITTTTISSIQGTPTQEGVYTFFLAVSTKSVFGTYEQGYSTATSLKPTSHSWQNCMWTIYPVSITIKSSVSAQVNGISEQANSINNNGAASELSESSFPLLVRDSVPSSGMEGVEYVSPVFNTYDGYISVLYGKLPKGLELVKSSGQYKLEGTPTRAGVYTFILLSQSNTYGSTRARVMPVTIAIDECISPDIPAQTLSSGKAREAYSETIEFTGSQPAILVVTNGILPEGLSLDVSGRISGTPSKSGTYEFTVEAVNFSGRAERKLMIVIEADTDISINAENFPDETFRKYVTNNFDSDSNGYLSESEISLITEIYANNKGITSLKGIEYFVNLRELYCNNNALTELDITSNTELTTLYCKGNSIASLDIRNCPNLNDFVHDNTAEIIDGTSEPAPDPDPEPEVVPEFKTQSVLLSGQIGLNFYMNLPEIDGVDYADKDCYMDFSINGSTKDNPPQMYDPEFMNASKKYYGFRCYINSIQMADPITATLHYGNNKTVNKVYSAKQYMDTALEYSSTSAEMKALAAAMKDYGHYMQIYLSQTRGWTIGKDHAEMDCVNVYTDADIAEAREAVQEYAISYDKGNSSIEKVTQSLNLDSETTINIYLKPKTSSTGDTETPEFGDDDTGIADGVSAFLDGGTQNLAVLQADGRYKVQIAGISAHKLAKTYTVTVHAGEIFDIKISAFSYVNALLKSASTSSAAKEAVTSLYKYYTATMAYRKSKGYTD